MRSRRPLRLSVESGFVRVLALDVGSSSVRAQLYDERAREVGAPARQAYEPRLGRDGSAELDADELVRAARAVLDTAGNAYDALAISCFWHSLLLLDGDRRPLTPVLLWQDRRAAAQAEELARRLDPQRVHQRTGCYLHPSYWPAKLAWLAAEQPETLARAKHAVSFGDYLFLQLTGELRSTLSTASGTGLLDLRGRAWDVRAARRARPRSRAAAAARRRAGRNGLPADRRRRVLEPRRRLHDAGSSRADDRNLGRVSGASRGRAGAAPGALLVLPRRAAGRRRRRGVRRRQPARLARARPRHRPHVARLEAARRARADVPAAARRRAQHRLEPAGHRRRRRASPSPPRPRTSRRPRSRGSPTGWPRSRTACPRSGRSSQPGMRCSRARSGSRSSPTPWGAR